MVAVEDGHAAATAFANLACLVAAKDLLQVAGAVVGAVEARSPAAGAALPTAAAVAAAAPVSVHWLE